MYDEVVSLGEQRMRKVGEAASGARDRNYKAIRIASKVVCRRAGRCIHVWS